MQLSFLAKKLGRIRINSREKVFGKMKIDTHAMGPPFFKISQNKATALGRKGWGVRDWGPHNTGVKSCGKSWTGGVPI